MDEIDNRIASIKRKMKDAAEALNPEHFKKLQSELDKLLAAKIPMWGSDVDN